jgi:hypothetical protein
MRNEKPMEMGKLEREILERKRKEFKESQKNGANNIDKYEKPMGKFEQEMYNRIVAERKQSAKEGEGKKDKGPRNRTK